jgi:LmbE family N-acetylglucosaminyl deacetylase
VSRVIGSIAALEDAYSDIYLSPHLDDAVLSCGGAIAGRARSGGRVLVVTACTGAPAEGAELGSIARRLHAWWGLSAPDAAQARRREDEAAAAIVGADVLWLDLLDAIYRAPEAYRDRGSLFGPIAPADPVIDSLGEALAAIVERCPGAALFAPLGVGGHVDHRAMHTAAAALAVPCAFYEDFPYITRPGALESRLDALGGAAQWVASARAVDATLALRIEAVRRYASQTGLLFGDDAKMTRAIAEHARGVAPPGAVFGEREWAVLASGVPFF